MTGAATDVAIDSREAEFELTTKQILAFASIILGVFLAFLDIQIVASSIGPLSVALGATIEEVAWIQSAYLIAEVIVIPLAAWLTAALSTRYLFLIAITGFTVMSLACASAWDLPSMIAFRLIQGATGGLMIPILMAAVYIIFPPSKQPIALAVAGFVTMFSAISGPVVGGWITELLSWHWLFLINVPVGMLVAVGVFLFVDFDKPDFSSLKRVDAWGILLIILFLGSGEFVLKEGTKYDWFESDIIFQLTIIALCSFALLIYRELSINDPVVNLRLFRDQNFAIGCVLSFTSGIVQFGSIYLLPAILATIRNFNSLQIGNAMFVMGVFMAVGMIVATIAARKVDVRIVMMAGLVIAAGGIWVDADLTNEVGGAQLILGQAMRGFGLALVMLTVTNVTIGGLAEEDVRNGSGLYNLMRNLGGAVGLAIITWLIQVRQDLHYHRISETLTTGNLSLDAVRGLPVPEMRLEEKLPSLDRTQTALVEMVTGMAEREALVMAYNDVWIVMTAFIVLSAVFVPFVRKPAENASPVAAH